MAQVLGLDAAEIASAQFAQVFGGNALYPGMQPWAVNYGGHQFGHWAGQLGDGRAISLGEAIGTDGGRYELQLKGAGPTPYSRGADGRAVLRSSIREFLCSEAMHHLGVPTTRALSLVGTGDAVVRDMFYDGHPQREPGAIVCRVAPSFIRFGNFELPSARGDIALLRQWVDFTIARDFPALAGAGEALYAGWFAQVCERTAVMVAHWMRVGFVHGVMNTDNMSILGLTIDYGPYGWVDDYDPDWTPNTTDAQGRRYRFGTQPQVAYWNLGRLAQALAPLFPDQAPLQHGLDRFRDTYLACDRHDTAAKLGLAECRDEDLQLIDALRALMRESEMDMTLTFRGLIDLSPDHPDPAQLREAFTTKTNALRMRRSCSNGCSATPRACSRIHCRRTRAARACAWPTRATCCAIIWRSRRSTAPNKGTRPGCRSCWRSCATHTTISPGAMHLRRGGRNGHAIALGVRCCRAVPDALRCRYAVNPAWMAYAA